MIEKRISFGSARMLPVLERDGSQPDAATVWRWAVHGVRGLKLESVVIGGRRFTTAEAVERFVHALSTGSSDTSAPTPQQRKREIAAAKARLQSAGI